MIFANEVNHFTSGLKFISRKLPEHGMVTDQIIIVQFQVFMNILHYILIKLGAKWTRIERIVQFLEFKIKCSRLKMLAQACTEIADGCLSLQQPFTSNFGRTHC